MKSQRNRIMAGRNPQIILTSSMKNKNKIMSPFEHKDLHDLGSLNKS